MASALTGRILNPRSDGVHYGPGVAQTELPDAGIIVVEDAETGELLSVDTSDPQFRRRFHEVATAREEDLQALAKRAGVPLYEVSTDDDLVRALMRIVESRRRQR